MALYIFLPIILIILILLLSCIKVVPQANAYVIEFLGSYKSTWEHGLHLKIPFVERIAGKSLPGSTAFILRSRSSSGSRERSL